MITMDSRFRMPTSWDIDGAFRVLFALKRYSFDRLDAALSLIPQILEFFSYLECDDEKEYVYLVEQFLMEVARRANEDADVRGYVHHVLTTTKDFYYVGSAPVPEDDSTAVDLMDIETTSVYEDAIDDFPAWNDEDLTSDVWPAHQLEEAYNYPPQPPPPVMDDWHVHRVMKPAPKTKSVPDGNQFPPSTVSSFHKLEDKLGTRRRVSRPEELPRLSCRTLRSYTYKHGGPERYSLTDSWRFAGPSICKSVTRREQLPVHRRMGRGICAKKALEIMNSSAGKPVGCSPP